MLISAIQYKPRFAASPADVSDNFRRCKPLIAQAGIQGAQMIVLPELAMTGYSFLSWDDAAAVSERKDGPTAQRMAQAAKETSSYVVWGFVEADGDTLYNSASMVSPAGDLVLTVRKLNLWGNDFLWAVPGEDLPGIVETDLGWTTIVVCRDILDKNPSGGRLFSSRKVDIAAAPVNWSGGGFPSTDWMDFVRANSCVLAVANRWGEESNRSFRHDFGRGGSAIIGKDARPHIGGLAFGSDSVVIAMVD